MKGLSSNQMVGLSPSSKLLSAFGHLHAMQTSSCQAGYCLIRLWAVTAVSAVPILASLSFVGHLPGMLVYTCDFLSKR